MNFLSVKDVAQMMGVNVSTVRANAAKGRYPFRAVRFGSLWKFPENEVKEYVYGKDYQETDNTVQD